MLWKFLYRLVELSFIWASTSSDPIPPNWRVSCYFQAGALLRKGRYQYTQSDLEESSKLCTHINYAFVGLNNVTWKIDVLNPEASLDHHGFEIVTQLAKERPGLTAVLSMGGWGEFGDKYSQVVETPERRKILIDDIIKYMNKYEFGGFDFDWEYPGDPDRGGRPQDKENLRIFYEELRQAFDTEAKGWEITMAVPVDRSTLEGGYDIPSMCKLLDALNVMAYDLRGPWNGFADIHSPLERRSFDTGNLTYKNVKDGMEYLHESGCPKEKLILGVPFYGKGFELLSNESTCLRSPTKTHLARGKNYFAICQEVEVPDSEYTVKFDSVAKCPYAFKGTEWLSYENPRSLKIKLDFLKETQYGGIMMWAMDLDDYRGFCGEPKNPLLTLINEELFADD